MTNYQISARRFPNYTRRFAIVDQILQNDATKLVAHTGMDALTCDDETFVSLAASDYTDAPALYAIQVDSEESGFVLMREIWA